MRIGSILEDRNAEKRVAITPEIAKKYNSLGFEVLLSKDYGLHLGFDDEKYKSQGANIFENEKDILTNSDIILQLGLPSDDNLSLLKENQNLIGVLNPFLNKEKLEKLSKKKFKFFEVPITYNGRSYEEGKKIRLKDAFIALKTIILYSLIG